MVRPEVTGRKMGLPEPELVDEVDAFTISEFCRRHRISLALFYKMRPQMPVTFNLGARVLISREAATAWRRERENAAALAE
jgi:hypothetical protein